jgi:hypothetical protein
VDHPDRVRRDSLGTLYREAVWRPSILMPETNPNHPNGKVLGIILRHAITIIIITFSLGGWVTKIQIEVIGLNRRVDKLESQMDERREERNEIKQHRASLDAVWGRVKALEKKP